MKPLRDPSVYFSKKVFWFNAHDVPPGGGKKKKRLAAVQPGRFKGAVVSVNGGRGEGGFWIKMKHTYTQI